jgi:hypothetical protein
MIESKIFCEFTGSGILAAFLFSGNSLNSSAVPEPTGALVALLMDAGMWIWTHPRVA